MTRAKSQFDWRNLFTAPTDKQELLIMSFKIFLVTFIALQLLTMIEVIIKVIMYCSGLFLFCTGFKLFQSN